jgi:hypothetical protein
MIVTENSCPVGKCWMGFTGGEVEVGGRGVGISVGGMRVTEGITFKVGGISVRVEVADTGVTGELHPTRDRRKKIIRMANRDFDFILYSSD